MKVTSFQDRNTLEYISSIEIMNNNQIKQKSNHIKQDDDTQQQAVVETVKQEYLNNCRITHWETECKQYTINTQYTVKHKPY